MINPMKSFKINSIATLSFLFLLCTSIILVSCDQDIEQNSETTVKVETPKTPLAMAAFMGDAKSVNGHIAAKSDLNQKDDYGSTPLTIAATFGKTEVAKLLIEAGADLNIASADGSTPLHTASFFGRTEIAKLLINNKADLSIRNSYGATALESLLASFDQVKPIYDQISKDLGPLGLKLDYEEIIVARPIIAEMIENGQ